MTQKINISSLNKQDTDSNKMIKDEKQVKESRAEDTVCRVECLLLQRNAACKSLFTESRHSLAASFAVHQRLCFRNPKSLLSISWFEAFVLCLRFFDQGRRWRKWEELMKQSQPLKLPLIVLNDDVHNLSVTLCQLLLLVSPISILCT